MDFRNKEDIYKSTKQFRKVRGRNLGERLQEIFKKLPTWVFNARYATVWLYSIKLVHELSISSGF